MSTLRNIVLGCVSDRSQEAAFAAAARTPKRIQKLEEELFLVTSSPEVSNSHSNYVHQLSSLNLEGFDSSTHSMSSSSSNRSPDLHSGSLGGAYSVPTIAVTGSVSSIEDKPPMEVKFGVPLVDALKDNNLPKPLVDLVIYIAQRGVATTDLFRRPGNQPDIRLIVKRLAEGREVDYSNYNFYTLASVLKKFLLRIPGGVFGEEAETKLLSVLDLENRMDQYDTIHSVISSLPQATQHLLALLFGTWFRIVTNSEFNTMSSEAVAKSVAGSLFHTCADDPANVTMAVHVLQILIDDFGVANMFGRKNIRYFADMTRMGISVREKYRYEFEYPGDRSRSVTEEEFFNPNLRSRTSTGRSEGSAGVQIRLASSPPSPQSLQAEDPNYNPHKKLTHVSSLSAPEVNQGIDSPAQDLQATKRMYLSSSLSRFDRVKQRQMMRMKKRSNWFLSPGSYNTSASIDSSVMGSCEVSVGKSSMEATSSEALVSDVTASDGGLSDTPASDGLRLSSDLECTFDDQSHHFHHHHHHHHHATSTPASEPLQRCRHLVRNQDVINANHGGDGSGGSSSRAGGSTSMATPAKKLEYGHSPTPSPAPSPALSPLHDISMAATTPTSQVQSVTENEVRYFMVEESYGSSQESSHS